MRGLETDAQAGLQAPPAGDGVASTRAFPRVGSGASSGGLGSKATGSVHWDPVSAGQQPGTLARVSISSECGLAQENEWR